MNSKQRVSRALALALAIAGGSVGGLAQAGGPAHVQWSVQIGAPLYLPLQPPPYVVQRQPVVVVAGPGYRLQDRRYAGWHDADRDGIPNRYDRVYNPRWDRDGDGVPNWRDRRDGGRDDWRAERRDGRYDGHRGHR